MISVGYRYSGETGVQLDGEEFCTPIGFVLCGGKFESRLGKSGNFADWLDIINSDYKDQWLVHFFSLVRVGLRAVSSVVIFVTKPSLEKCIKALYALCINFLAWDCGFYYSILEYWLCLWIFTLVWYTSVIRGRLFWAFWVYWF